MREQKLNMLIVKLSEHSLSTQLLCMTWSPWHKALNGPIYIHCVRDSSSSRERNTVTTCTLSEIFFQRLNRSKNSKRYKYTVHKFKIVVINLLLFHLFKQTSKFPIGILKKVTILFPEILSEYPICTYMPQMEQKLRKLQSNCLYLLKWQFTL